MRNNIFLLIRSTPISLKERGDACGNRTWLAEIHSRVLTKGVQHNLAPHRHRNKTSNGFNHRSVVVVADPDTNSDRGSVADRPRVTRVVRRSCFDSYIIARERK